MKRTIQWVALTATALAAATVAHADLLQAPVQATASVVPPNLMFTLDDSGSMFYECLPDSLCAASTYEVGAFPDANANKDGTATNATNNAFQKRIRSNSQNPLYYNPAITYLPWLKSDGTRFPNASPTAARTFPESTANAATMNLVANQSITTAWCTSTTSCSNATQTMYFARYFTLKAGGSPTTAGDYTEVKIQSGGTYPKAATRTDCAGSTCTFDEEAQNFANFYSYHRSRFRVAIAGTSEAFYAIPDTYRVGYGRINKTTSSSVDGFSIPTIEKGLRSFDTTASGNKVSFYTWLASRTPAGSTPLRRAMDDVGQYFSYTDSRGPWGETPGTNSNTPAVACRRSFHVLMTDGMWNTGPASTTAARANVDNTNGPTISGVNSQSYQYKPVAPYKDSNSDSLADIAMYYWNRDLNPDVDNAVRPTSNNPAFWQHLVDYTISFGVAGVLDYPGSMPGLVAGTTNWPATSGAGAGVAANVDDLWHAAVNSRGRYLSARNANEYAQALKSIIDEISAINGSESGVAVSAKAISASTAVRKYEPTYASAQWSGDVEAINLTANGENNGTAWKASQNMPLPAARNIIVGNAAATSAPYAVNFTWATMTAAMKTKMVGTASNGSDVVDYLRGVRTLEGTSMRTRASPLGDVVNSAPVMVKDQFDGQYDFLPSSASAQANAYRSFLDAKKLREGQLFVGMNDGMLHAFSDSNGRESFAYMPDSVLSVVKNLADPNYTHRYYVDGPLTEADVYDTNASKWRNLVIGGTGAGAKSMFAINVPVTTTTTALNATTSAPGASDLLWEISSAKTGFEEMGYVLSTAEHGMTRDGSWVVIFGNGYESTSKKAQLFIVNAVTGALIRKIDTGSGSTANPNGLGGVRVVRNVNKQIVSVYGGDLLGNMWKFDLSANTPGSWNVAFGGAPLTTTSPAQPITAAPTYVVHPSGGVMVLYGTGKLFEVGDITDMASRTLYGVWDSVGVGSSSAAASGVVAQSDLVAQAFVPGTNAAGSFSTLTVTPVDYSTKKGWRLPLNLISGQRLVDDPEISVGRVFMQTVSPTSAMASCAASNLIRHAIVLDPFMGAINGPTFDTNADGLINTSDSMTSVSLQLNVNGPSSVVRKSGTNRSILLAAGSSGSQFQGISSTTRRYWREIISHP